MRREASALLCSARNARPRLQESWSLRTKAHPALWPERRWNGKRFRLTVRLAVQRQQRGLRALRCAVRARYL